MWYDSACHSYVGPFYFKVPWTLQTFLWCPCSSDNLPHRLPSAWKTLPRPFRSVIPPSFSCCPSSPIAYFFSLSPPACRLPLFLYLSRLRGLLPFLLSINYLLSALEMSSTSYCVSGRGHRVYALIRSYTGFCGPVDHSAIWCSSHRQL